MVNLRQSIILFIPILLAGCPATSKWEFENQSDKDISIGVITSDIFEKVKIRTIPPGSSQKHKFLFQKCIKIINHDDQLEFYLWDDEKLRSVYNNPRLLKNAKFVYLDSSLKIRINEVDVRPIEFDRVDNSIEELCK